MTYTVISRNQCNFCDTAKAILKGAGISYVEFNVSTDSSKWVLTLMKNANMKTVPQIFYSDGTHIGGHAELREFLDIIQGSPV